MRAWGSEEPPVGGETSGQTYCCAMTMKTRLIVISAIAAFVGLFSLMAAAQAHDSGWRKALGFDVMAKERIRKADLGNHRRVVASWVSDLGWEIEVLKYGDKTKQNLLYDGNNWHGLQPWMVWAGTKHEKTYPDVRDVTYDKGNSHIRIVLVDCQTKQVGSNSFRFVQGRIDVFAKP